ncbi:MAG: DUF4097 domain-containing protein [Chloroflexaceae bacterium]|nr:DUF4097 domain-containing protein [Chloroflexaceae bacterium]
MSQQTCSTTTTPLVQLDQMRGDVQVRTWYQSAVGISSYDQHMAVQQEADTVTINGAQGDVLIQVPAGASLTISRVRGDVDITGVQKVQLNEIKGDVILEQISDPVDVHVLGADLTMTDGPALWSRGGIRGDVTITRVRQVGLEQAGHDVVLEQVETAMLGTIDGDLDATDITVSLRCGNVGGDCHVHGSNRTELVLGNVGDDLEVQQVAQLQAGSVAHTCRLREVHGAVEVGNVGGNVSLQTIHGHIQMGHLAANADLRDIQGNIEVSSVGHDLKLRSPFLAETRARLRVHGDAIILLPPNPDLSIRATVEGMLIGAEAESSGEQIGFTYGQGNARLELSVKGNLELRGREESPESSSDLWEDMEREVADFGREMADLGMEMGNLAQKLGRDVLSSFTDADWLPGPAWAESFLGQVEEESRQARQRIDKEFRRAQRRAEEQARRARRHAERDSRTAGSERAGPGRRRAKARHDASARVRYHNREWQFDPKQFERLQAAALAAANEGIAGACEAVERALENLGGTHAPRGGAQQRRRNHGNTRASTPPSDSTSVNTGPTVRLDPQQAQPTKPEAKAPGAAAPANAEQDRMAILQMVAEGRITPEEGDMLLEGLG